jgi:hypothetical protein
MLTKAPLATPWTRAGPYLGFNIGYGRGKSSTDTVLSDTVAGTPLLATNDFIDISCTACATCAMAQGAQGPAQAA